MTTLLAGLRSLKQSRIIPLSLSLALVVSAAWIFNLAMTNRSTRLAEPIRPVIESQVLGVDDACGEQGQLAPSDKNRLDCPER